MKLTFSGVSRNSNTKFHQDPSSGSRVVPCGRTDGHTDMRKLIIAFRCEVPSVLLCSVQHSEWRFSFDAAKLQKMFKSVDCSKWSRFGASLKQFIDLGEEEKPVITSDPYPLCTNTQ